MSTITRHVLIGLGAGVFVSLSGVARADVLALYIDGTDRAVGSTTRGQAGRAAWTAAVRAEGRAIVNDDFDGVQIDVPAGTATRVGHFSVYFEQAGGYSPQAGDTSPDPHPTGIFVGTTGVGGGANAETIEGLELRYETREQVTTVLELRFDPPIRAWAADVFSVDGPGFGAGFGSGGGPPSANDHTTLHLGPHAFDLGELFEYSGSGYMSFFGIVADEPFDRLRITAQGDGDRFRLDNVSLGR